MTQRVKRRDRLRKQSQREMPAKIDIEVTSATAKNPNSTFLDHVDRKITESVLGKNQAYNHAVIPAQWTTLPVPTLETMVQLDYLQNEADRMFGEMSGRQFGRQYAFESTARRALLEGKSVCEATPKGLNRLSLGPEGQVVRTFIEGSEPKPGARGVDLAEAVIIYDSLQEKS